MRRAASTSESRLAAALSALLVLGGCGREPDRVEQLHVFGTLAEFRLRDAPPAQAQAALAEIAATLNQREREWHAWQDSDLTRINAAFARGESAEAPDSVLMLLRRSQQLSEASEGLFDPAIGGLVAAWGFHTSTFPILAPLPGDASLQAWRDQRPRVTEVRVDGRSLSAPNPRTQLDFDAIAEGAAAQETLDTLRRHGIRHALVNLGGDVVALAPLGAGPWQVSLRDPFGGVLGTVPLGDGEALFTSGNYNKFRYSSTGARQPHILDPRTGHPARGAAAVVVLHADPMLADAAASALFVAGPSGFEALVRRMGLGCALMVTDENEMLITVAMKARLQALRDPVPLGPPLDLGANCVAAPAG